MHGHCHLKWEVVTVFRVKTSAIGVCEVEGRLRIAKTAVRCQMCCATLRIPVNAHICLFRYPYPGGYPVCISSEIRFPALMVLVLHNKESCSYHVSYKKLRKAFNVLKFFSHCCIDVICSWMSSLRGLSGITLTPFSDKLLHLTSYVAKDLSTPHFRLPAKKKKILTSYFLQEIFTSPHLKLTSKVFPHLTSNFLLNFFPTSVIFPRLTPHLTSDYVRRGWGDCLPSSAIVRMPTSGPYKVECIIHVMRPILKVGGWGSDSM